MAVRNYLANIWSATDFRTPDLARYAEPQIRNDTRQGVQLLASLSLSIHVAIWLVIVRNGAGSVNIYSHVLLAALSLHILISARFVDDIRALEGLGMVLLIVSALAVIFVAHAAGDLSIGMMAAIIMLLISVPLVPWALREATIVIGLTIVLLTSSIMSVPGRFNLEALWLLQLLVLGSTVIVAVLVTRNIALRKRDIRVRFELDNARKKMRLLSMKDHLTGAWNRRYLETEFPKIAKDCREQRKTLHVAVLDIDDFKIINDRYGHQLADGVLESIGTAFMQQLADQGSLVRLGGDEFLILYCGDDLEALIDRAVNEMHDDPSAKKITDECDISLSAGFASAGPDETADPEKLYMAADKALYLMKKSRHSVAEAGTAECEFSRTGVWNL